MKRRNIIAVAVLIVLFCNPWTIRFLKKQFVVVNPNSSINIAFRHSNNNYAEEFEHGLLTYDGLSLKLIETDGTERFDVTINADNYNISTSKNRIFLLDIAKKNVYILDGKGKIVNQITVDYLPKRVVALDNGNFVVHYFTDVYIEGIKLFSENGKMLNDITYPNVTLTLIQGDKNNHFAVLGFFKNGSSLENSVYFYNYAGELQYASQINNVIIHQLLFQKNKVLMLDINSILTCDTTFEEVSSMELPLVLKKVVANEKNIYLLTKDNSIQVMDSEFQNTDQLSSQEKIIDMFLVDDKLIYYTQNSILCNYDKRQFSKDIVKVIPVDDTLIILFKNEIKIIQNDF